MSNRPIELIDLPDELILIILKKLNNIVAFYSLMGFNKRIDRILSDSIFTRCLTLARSSSSKQIYSLDEKMLNRFCLEILPKIHDKIEFLTVEFSLMERILFVDNYPNLFKVGIANLCWNGLTQIFNEKNLTIHKLKNQISILYLSINDHQNELIHDNITKFLFENILKIFPNLIDLRFFKLSSIDLNYLSFNDKIKIFPSNLVELHINVDGLNDCLYLLNGELNNLENFYVNINHIYSLPSNVSIKGKFDQLKLFSLKSKNITWCYKQWIVPILNQMINLEKLYLYLMIYENNTIIDGNKLKNDFINSMKKLNFFHFNIQLRFNVNCDDQIDIPSNDSFKLTFQNFSNKEIFSCIDYFEDLSVVQCHYYSYPYTLEYYLNLTNQFSNGLFEYVRHLSLYDEHPFEHEFFFKISKSFPYLQHLTIENFYEQNSSLNKNDKQFPLIEYPYLIQLDLIYVHDHYIEQFLSHSKTFLLNKIYLKIRYDSLERVTNNFTREQTRFNSNKIQKICLQTQKECSKEFYQYFPNVKSFIKCDLYTSIDD